MGVGRCVGWGVGLGLGIGVGNIVGACVGTGEGSDDGARDGRGDGGGVGLDLLLDTRRSKTFREVDVNIRSSEGNHAKKERAINRSQKGREARLANVSLLNLR